MEKYLELFKKYAFTENAHKNWSDEPFYFEGHMYVTDRNSALRIKSDLLDNLPALTHESAGIKLKEMCDSIQNISFCILTSTIDSHLSKVEKEDVTERPNCKACESTGQVEYEFEYDRRTYEELLDCPVCDGGHPIKTGEKVYPITVFFKIGNCFFSAKYISLLKEIADFEKASVIKLIHQTEELKYSLFRIGNIDIVLMPCSLSSEDFTIINFD